MMSTIDDQTTVNILDDSNQNKADLNMPSIKQNWKIFFKTNLQSGTGYRGKFQIFKNIGNSAKNKGEVVQQEKLAIITNSNENQ